MDAKFVVEIDCPQCGAPGTMEETSRLFLCPYCNVKSYLVPRKVFTYVLPSRAPEGKEIIYFPYWRFRGIYFACVPYAVEGVGIDEVLQAAPSDYFPFNLGYKTQVWTLQPTGPRFKGRIFSPTISYKEAVDYFKAHLERHFHSEFIGFTEIIYAPFYLHHHTVYDGITNRRVDEYRDETIRVDQDLMEQLPASGPMEQNLKTLSTLCPSCGWDMDCARDSFLVACNHCGSYWQPGWNGFKRLAAAHLPAEGQVALYLPFWRIQAEIIGVQLASYEDLIRVANLTKVAGEEERRQPFCFWIPAFRIDSPLFLQIAARVTLGQPRGRLDRTTPAEQVYPVNLPMQESLRSLKSVLADFIRDREVHYPLLDRIRIKPKRLALIFLPFQAMGSEIVHPQYRVRMTRQTLEHFKRA